MNFLEKKNENMKSQLLPLFSLIIIIVITTSCSHKYYAPNDGEFIMLTKRNDVHLSQSISGGNLSSGSTQLGFSPLKYLGLTGSLFTVKSGNNDPNNNTVEKAGNGKIWNTAIGGYYHFLFKEQFNSINSPQTGILADVYFGYGKGEVNNYYEVGGSSHFNFEKQYAQIGTYLILEHINVGYQFRIGRLNYYDGKILGQATGLTMESFNLLNEQNNFRIMEHSFQFSYGIKQCRIFMRSTGIGHNKDLEKLGVKNTNTTIGIILEIDEFFRKNKSEEVEKYIDF